MHLVINTRLYAILRIGLFNGNSRNFKSIQFYLTVYAYCFNFSPGLGGMTPEHIDPCLCTHIIYAFSEMTDNKLSPMEKYDHVDGDKPGYFERVNNWKSKNPKLRTLLAVGGWVYLICY